MISLPRILDAIQSIIRKRISIYSHEEYMSQSIMEIKRILISIEQITLSIYESILSSLSGATFTIHHFYLLIIALLSIKILFSKKKTAIPKALQERIATSLREKNATIDKAKLYIHIFTTTIAEYRKNVDRLLENRASIRGVLIIRTAGGKVPILTTESFYTLLYCAVAFTDTKKPFEKDKQKQRKYIEKALGFLPTLDKNSTSEYHSYITLAQMTSKEFDIHSLQNAS